MTRIEQIGSATLYLGDCLEVLPMIDGVEAFVLDPPYSSGGQFRGDRTAPPSSKYIQTGSDFTCRAEFAGDNRDQRAFLAWSALWFGYMLRASVPGATVCAFTDWRQLPTMTDAIQAGGWVWRNIVTWWKPGIRMTRGRFSQSAEYIAEKPVALLKDILGITRPGAMVADPFMGSGTTGVACARMGRPFIGIEIDPFHFESACHRIEEAHRQRDMFTSWRPAEIDPADEHMADLFAGHGT
jgi:site-specific DNA-methyltransferase (adenine-specific)